MDPTFAGIIEAWALGVSWSELLTLTSVQEGDLIRLLRRVLDMLRQIPRLPFVPNDRGASTALRLNARRAVTLMDRFPVSDDVTYTVSEEELMSGMTSEGLQTDMKLPKGEVKRAEVMGWEDGEVSEVLEGEDLYVQSRGSSYSDDAEAVDAEWTPGSDDEAGEYDDDDDDEDEDEDEDEFAFSPRGKRKGGRGVSPRARDDDDEDFIKSLGLGYEPSSLPGDISI